MLWFVLLVLTNYGLVPFLKPLFQAFKTKNYRAQEVVTGLGVSFVFSSTLAIMLKQREANLFVSTILFFCLLGLMDDFLGDDSKGVAGHFQKGKVTTGTIKALFGCAFSFVAALSFSSGWLDILTNVVLITAGANLLNLLDLQPGRAGKTFLVLGFILVVAGGSSGPLLFLLAAVIGYLPWDLGESVIMGDTGSNPLGAALGLSAALILPQVVRVVLAVLVLAINLGAEKWSISKLIESNEILKFLDRLGR